MALDDLGTGSWKKSKHSKRSHLQQSEEEYLAVCLVMMRDGRGYQTSDDDDDSAAAVSATPSETKVKKHQAPSLSTAAPTATAANSYKCNRCDKVFSSHQALGGHTASHRVKPSTTIPVSVTSDESNPSTAVTTVASSFVSALNPSGRPHECSICHKVFRSGQALGGHKRKHYEGPIGGCSAKSRSRTTSSNGAPASDQKTAVTSDQIQTTIAVARCFDLNMPPSPELQGDEAESVPPSLFP